MPIRKIPFVPGEFYHLYNRGNSKQTIFKTEADYTRFMALLFAANGTVSLDFREMNQDELFSFDRGEKQIEIGAYCLMPNHFHILATPVVEGGITTYMRKLTTGYSMYFNKKHLRTGSLFEGRFKSEHADEDRYLKYLFAYIHLNPVKLIQSDWRKKGIENKEEVLDYLQGYKYSSYIDNSVDRTESNIISREKFPEYFSDKKAYDEEMMEWLSFGFK